MASEPLHTTKPPFQPSKWLLEAARKRSGAPSAPSKALLDSIQHARDHPHEVARKLREDALKNGRDCNALASWMAERIKKHPQTNLAQRLRNAPTELVHHQAETAVESGAVSEDGEIAETHGTPSSLAFGSVGVSEDGQVAVPASPPRFAASKSRSATPPTERLAPASPRATRRVGAKGQIAKPTLTKKKGQTAEKIKQGGKKPTKNVKTNSGSDAASPMDMDSLEPVAESSASGALRESYIAATRTLTDPAPSTTPPNPRSYTFPTRPSMPAWYLSVSKQSQDLLERKRPQELAAIDALKACIGRCEHEKLTVKLNKEHNNLRDYVHKAESSLNMDKVKVKKTRILTEAGLPRIFNENANFPWDLKADAWHLYERWMNEDFERDILRGIVTVKGKDRNGDRLDPAYRLQHPKDPKTFGDNGAVLGQWWPSQLCAVRDGIHGAAQGGIYGDKEQGAYSIILSSGGYHDKDDGDTIEYSGTDGSNFNMTAATQCMITSATLGNHIRVLRSAQLPKSNKHRPEVGLRYDGLYQIKSYREINLEKQTYLFHLDRVPGQEPIRSQGVTARPTVFEKQEYDRCKGRI